MSKSVVFLWITESVIVWVTQENLELPLNPNSLDSHQTQNNKM